MQQQLDVEFRFDTTKRRLQDVDALRGAPEIQLLAERQEAPQGKAP